MKKQTFGRKALALLLATLCLSSLYGCGGEKAGGETDTAPETETAETESLLCTPERNYNDTDFSILYLAGESEPYAVADIWSDGYTGEVINDSVYDRNCKLEQALGIAIVPIPNTDIAGAVKAEVTAGGRSYDVVSDQMKRLFSLGIENYLYDWNTLTYIDVNDPWWDKLAADELSLKKHLYLMAGDISMETFSGARFLYFNKAMMQEYGFTAPYKQAEKGAWTFDEMLQMIKSIGVDLNGDGKMDSYDRYGMLVETPTFFLSGCGILFSSKDEDDLPVIDFATERTVNVLEKVASLFEDTEHTINYEKAAKGRDTGAYAHIYDFGRSLFAGGQFLFVQNGAKAAVQFADMDDGYGVLPNPKFDAEQQEYYHLVDCFRCAIAIPATVNDIERVDIVLDNWSYFSTSTVRDAYYETTLKKKRLDAPEDARMMDIVWNTKRYEITYIYDIGVMGILNSAYSSGNLMSTYQKEIGAVEKKLSLILEKVN